MPTGTERLEARSSASMASGSRVQFPSGARGSRHPTSCWYRRCAASNFRTCRTSRYSARSGYSISTRSARRLRRVGSKCEPRALPGLSLAAAVRIAVIETGGWDSHANQGSAVQGP